MSCHSALDAELTKTRNRFCIVAQNDKTGNAKHIQTNKRR